MEKVKSKKDIESIKKAIEEAIGFQVETPKTFELLRQIIFQRTREYVSATTLKRIWGYLDEPVKTRRTTLSLLARTIGYKDWDDFLYSRGSGLPARKIPSNPNFGRSLNVTADLKAGDRIKLYWNPGRECLVRYLGNMQFVVEESQKTRLKPGDTFFCHLIIAGHPLYLSNLVQGASEPVAYVCGRIHGGIRYEMLEASSH